MEFFRMAFLNIYNGAPSSFMKVGFVVSVLLLLFYVGFSYLMIKYINMRIIKREEEIDGCIQNFELIFEEFPKVMSKNYFHYLPFISMIKDFLSQLLLVLLGGTSLAQLWVLVSLELVGVYIGTLYFRAMKGWKRYIQITQSITYLLIVSVYILVNYGDFEESIREVRIGWTLCVFYTVILGTAVIRMIADPVEAIWTKIKQRRSVSGVVPKENAPATVVQSQEQPSRMMNRPTPLKVRVRRDIAEKNQGSNQQFEKPLHKFTKRSSFMNDLHSSRLSLGQPLDNDKKGDSKAELIEENKAEGGKKVSDSQLEQLEMKEKEIKPMLANQGSRKRIELTKRIKLTPMKSTVRVKP